MSNFFKVFTPKKWKQEICSQGIIDEKECEEFPLMD